MRLRCPPWCVADHPADAGPGRIRHRSRTREVPVVREGRGRDGPHAAELVVEVSRHADEAAVWVYLGDGWTGFSLSLGSAVGLSDALRDALRDAGGA